MKHFVRDPFTDRKVIFCVGFQAGSFVWAARSIAQAGSTGVRLTSASVWPYMGRIPYTMEELQEGVVHDDNVAMALDLNTATQLWLITTRKRKERADRAFSQVSALERAVTERNRPLLMAAIAEEQGK